MIVNYFVSIIIPTYNEEADIQRTLDACVNLKYPHKEIIIVDDSTDSTPDIVKEYESSGVKLIKRQRNEGGRCGARNVGILKARGDIIVVLNADVFPEPDFVDCILPHYDKGADYLLVSSRIANQGHLFARFVEAQYHYNYDGQDWIEWTEGFSCRRKIALDIGMFPVTPIPLVAGEDGYLGGKFSEKGYKKVIDRSIIVPHIAPHKLNDYWRARKEKNSPLTSFFLYRKPIWYLSLQTFAKTILTSIQLLLIVPIIYKAFKISRFSPMKNKDIIPFTIAYTIQSVAFLAGKWHGMAKLFKYKIKNILFS